MVPKKKRFLMATVQLLNKNLATVVFSITENITNSLKNTSF